MIGRLDSFVALGALGLSMKKMRYLFISRQPINPVGRDPSGDCARPS